MSGFVLLIVLLPLAAAAAFFVGFYLRAHLSQGRILRAEQAAGQHERETELARKASEVEAREKVQQLRETAEAELRQARRECSEKEKELDQRERDVDSLSGKLTSKEGELLARENRLAKAEEAVRARVHEAEARAAEAVQRLESLAGLTRDAARAQILRQAEEESRTAAARMAAQIRENAVREADREARRLIGMAVQRLASEHTIETTVTVLTLPSDDMKGRIIGREGRNIRAFEMATGVDVIIDDTPEAVLLSSFDPVRREVARRALLALIEDGRIHPGRIEEVVQKVEGDLKADSLAAAEHAALEVGVPGLAPEILEIVGRLDYRTSFGQNLLRHSIEVAQLAGLLASELKLDPALARRIGFLHDVGKALDQDHNGSHALAGADLLRRVSERAEVVESVAAHHGEVPAQTPYAWILQSADAISGARPGARREKLETYLKRLEQLETIAGSFPGVDRSFAIQAGRELRILVQSKEVSDGDAAGLAAGVAARIEKELQYPGQIKVVVIRETRAVDFAR
jgi:ribonucrease Y